MPYLTLLSSEPGGKAKLIPVPAGRPFTIGRGKTTSFRVCDRKMSRVHCELSVAGGIAVITDLGSTNGTHVNAKRIASTALKDGDVIQVGYTRFRYHGGEVRSATGRFSRGAAPNPPGPQASAADLDSSGIVVLEEPEPPVSPAAGPDSEGIVVVEEPEPPVSPAAPAGPDDETVAQRLSIVVERPERPLRKGEAVCCSCRQVVAAKELKTGAATDVHGQVCCPRCIEADPLIGQELAGYRIDVKLGAGPRFATYKAEQLSMARSVVLRVLRPEVCADNELVTRFLAAVKRGGQISHPNLVRIYDIGRTDELCYVSGEFIDGESLARRLDRKPGPPVSAAVDTILQVGSAVDAAHRRGVFHRDIRPANIIFNDEAVAKLIGLGFAKSLEESLAAGGTTVPHAADAIHYWVPECIVEPQLATPHADVYALGAVLYAALAGRPPFHAGDPVELVRQIRKLRPRPLGAVRQDVPHRLSAVVTKAMAKNPDDRHPGCGQFIRDLRSAAQGG